MPYCKGIKPLIPYQHRFRNFYLFGAYWPVNGDHYTLELPDCNTDCFQQYLNGLSAYQPDGFKIVVLDNGAFHKAGRLIVPATIGLLFLPPYSPELNPAEMMWRYIKDRLGNQVHETLEQLSDKVMKIIQSLDTQIIQSITGWKLYRNCNI
jgi:transposase